MDILGFGLLLWRTRPVMCVGSLLLALLVTVVAGVRAGRGTVNLRQIRKDDGL